MPFGNEFRCFIAGVIPFAVTDGRAWLLSRPLAVPVSPLRALQQAAVLAKEALPVALVRRYRYDHLVLPVPVPLHDRRWPLMQPGLRLRLCHCELRIECHWRRGVGSDTHGRFKVRFNNLKLWILQVVLLTSYGSELLEVSDSVTASGTSSSRAWH